MNRTPVLIAGAGPTGLVLALGLSQRGVPFRIVDENAEAGQRSRAMAVQARTLEFYDQFGLAAEVIERGVKIAAAHIREGNTLNSHEVLAVSFDKLGGGLSPFPFVLAYPQDDHERFLVEQLKARGIEVERPLRLGNFQQDDESIVATLVRPDGQEEEIRADYLCGCDGAHSRVREALELPFLGGTYAQLYYVADVKIDRGFTSDLFVNLGKHVLVVMLPVRSSGMQRLIGLVPPELVERKDLSFEDLRTTIEPMLGLKVTELNWFSSYRVHHRVAEHFKVGRAFLLGDAGHLHSPAGGQGMNTGIGDAINLGWKLAAVIRGRAAAELLETYESERIRFARTLVETTDRIFTQIVASGIKGELTRRVLAPLLLGAATRLQIGRQTFFRTISQIHVHYPDSALSEGHAGQVRGGDRLPWTGSDGPNNFLPLRSLDWQVHVYGNLQEEFRSACARAGLTMHSFPWGSAAELAGLQRDGAYLVRPDGYVALASPDQSVFRLVNFLRRWELGGLG